MLLVCGRVDTACLRSDQGSLQGRLAKLTSQLSSALSALPEAEASTVEEQLQLLQHLITAAVEQLQREQECRSQVMLVADCMPG